MNDLEKWEKFHREFVPELFSSKSNYLSYRFRMECVYSPNEGIDFNVLGDPYVTEIRNESVYLDMTVWHWLARILTLWLWRPMPSRITFPAGKNAMLAKISIRSAFLRKFDPSVGSPPNWSGWVLSSPMGEYSNAEEFKRQVEILKIYPDDRGQPFKYVLFALGSRPV